MQYFEDNKKKLEETLFCANKIEPFLGEISGMGASVTVHTDVWIVFGSLDQLHAVRAIAKKVYPDHKADFRYAFASNGGVIGVYNDDRYPALQLHLSTSEDDFPAELLGGNCKFVDCKVNDRSLVCEV